MWGLNPRQDEDYGLGVWAWRWDLGYTLKHVVSKLGFRARPGLMVRVKRK